MLKIIEKKKVLRDKFLSLRSSISKSEVKTPRNVSRFVFLCGANINNTEISKRRNAIIGFAKKRLPHTKFFIAEKMFPILQKEENKDNMLDIENEISKFADKIVVVLESASSFTELGVFSHDTRLREKLIVINDSKFRGSKSFINMGPLKAIEESSGQNHVIDYKMNEDGVYQLDPIGDIYDSLFEILKEPIRGKPSAVTLEDCNPGNNFNKKSAMMVHDLVYFSGPILHKELVEVLALVFGQQSFNKVKQHEAILVAINFLKRTREGFYKSRLRKQYYDYEFDINGLISTCRNYMLKFHPDRIYGHQGKNIN